MTQSAIDNHNRPSESADMNVGYQSDQSQLRRSSRAPSVSNVPNMVTPSADSRVSMTQPRPQKRPEAPSSDLGQSDHISRDASQKKKKRQPAKKNTPVQKRGSKGKSKNSAGGNEVYCGHNSTNGNLTTHRDGSNQAGRNPKGCINRDQAKKAGVKLPPSVAEKRVLDTKQPTINMFLQSKPVFVNRVLNQIVMIWQIRQALTWARIEDPYLQAAFQYANNKASLYGKRWSADESKKLYLMLKTTVFDDLEKLDTKFTLVHDVWTTKGNRFAFIGASVAYVDSSWEYVVRHLALKMIPWKHYGHLLARPIAALLKKRKLYQKMLAQTTDSGSNNNTMASAMYDLLKENNPTKSSEHSWDPTSMHMRCFFHKLALIVNAGLGALSLKTLPPGKTKESVLGFFPVLGKLLEEDETESVVPAPEIQQATDAQTITLAQGNTYDYWSDYGNADDEMSDTGRAAEDQDGVNDDEDTVAAEAIMDSSHTKSKHQKTLRLKELTDKLDVVIKQITRSAAQRASFDRMAKELNVKVSPLIAGYGIRWNIKYESHRKAILTREVIDRLLKDDQEQNQSQDFSDVWFSPRDWKDIDNLNRELEVFVKLTSQMEGNQPTGAHVLPKYLDLKDQINEKLARSEEKDMLYPMFHAMLNRVKKYLDEAMNCETLVLARDGRFGSGYPRRCGYPVSFSGESGIRTRIRTPWRISPRLSGYPSGYPRIPAL
ncbi:hypothetical protein PGT21_008570 [Puccinia graminis f. sp. tritici]|uniref:hAT-like transposase RNase-H fold domain-containing protein n=1 Tax=Puccinia graminis f. sp. tritici TaxID=56615 RepID=A0A5B0PAZ5_PUCGR|nr:hypothetical protein PGT21_008570 [Puccinia graminis f. sp. tritici]